MLEDVVKADDVEDGAFRKVLRKEPGYDREPVTARLSGDSRIRLQAGREIATPRGLLQEPPVRAADVEEPGRLRNRKLLEGIQHAFEAAMPKSVKGLSSFGLVDSAVGRVVPDGRRQSGREEAAPLAFEPVAPVRTVHFGLAEKAVHQWCGQASNY